MGRVGMLVRRIENERQAIVDFFDKMELVQKRWENDFSDEMQAHYRKAATRNTSTVGYAWTRSLSSSYAGYGSGTHYSITTTASTGGYW